MIIALRQLSYDDRRKQCKSATLETKRIRGHQIEVCKIMSGFEDIDKSKFFKVREAYITRARNLMISKDQCKLDIKK